MKRLIRVAPNRRNKSGNTRQEQKRISEKKRRERLRKEGKLPVGVWISEEALSIMDALGDLHTLDRSETLESILLGRIKPQSKPKPRKSSTTEAPVSHDLFGSD